MGLRSASRFFWGAIGLVVFLLLLALATKNDHFVAVHFLFDMSWRLPLSLLLFCALGTGVLLGIFALLGSVIRLRLMLRRLRHEVRNLREKVPPPGG